MNLRWFILPIFLFSACHSRDRVHVETDEGPPRLAEMISMSDAKSSPQLLDGFYGLEDKLLALDRRTLQCSPAPSCLRGRKRSGFEGSSWASPKPLIDRVKTTALTATIQGTKLSPESFTQAGSVTSSCVMFQQDCSTANP